MQSQVVVRRDVFRDSVCIITGGTSGIGRALASRLARSGALVGLIARGETAMQATLSELREAGATACGVRADVADPEQVFAASDELAATLGPIDYWFNNAMTTVFSWIESLTPDELRRVTDVTYHGAVWGTLAALRHMSPRNRGTIVQVGSALAYRAIPLQAAYCASKHAMRGFTDSLRAELLAKGSQITVTMVQLPAVNTPQFVHCRSKLGVQPQPVPPIYQPEAIAEAIVKATARPRRESLIGFPTIKTVFGGQLAPGIADRYLSRNGIDAQKTERPSSGQENLFAPVEEDMGIRGPFERDRRGTWLTPTAWLGAGGLRAILLAAATLIVVAIVAAAVVVVGWAAQA